MHYPNLSEEKKLWRMGYKNVISLDEAGCGPLAGPVVAGAVMILNPKFETLNPKQIPNSKFKFSKHVLNFGHCDLFRNSDLGFRILLNEVRDSKKISRQKRERLYSLIIKNLNIRWGIGVVSEKIIDKINIKNAAELAMEKALHNLKCKIHNAKIDFLIIDGKYLKSKKLRATSYKMIVKADEKILSCAMASIIAKVTRDKIMMKYHEKYPKYRFDLHKGYCVKKHLSMLKKYGPCRIHRRSFLPVISCQNK